MRETPNLPSEFRNFDCAQAQEYLSAAPGGVNVMRELIRNKRIRLTAPTESAELLRWIADQTKVVSIDEVNARLAAAHTSMNDLRWAMSLKDIEVVFGLLSGWKKLPMNPKGIRGNRIHALFSFVSVGWQIYVLNGRSGEALQLLSVGSDFFRSLDNRLLEKAFFLQTSAGVFRVLAAHSALLVSAGKEQQAESNLEDMRRAVHLSLRAAGQRDVSSKISKEFLAGARCGVQMERVLSGGIYRKQDFSESDAELPTTEQILTPAIRANSKIRNEIIHAYRSQSPTTLLTPNSTHHILTLRQSLQLKP